MSADRFDEFIKLLTQLPLEVWPAAVVEQPGWKWMQPLSKVWKFGPFTALFIAIGLNNYQLRGSVEAGYWPKLAPLIPRNPEPKNPQQLVEILEPFYSRERFATNKLKRLRRFLESDLCREIWVSNATSLATNFERIWQSLGCTMQQQPTDKTIALAMKCLALALLMVDEAGFDFSAVPVPVDSRIRRISARLGCPEEDQVVERERWRKVLDSIRKSHPEITMVHLDSLLWQIGTLSPQEMKSHLIKLGGGNLALRISQLFYGRDAPSSRSHCHT